MSSSSNARSDMSGYRNLARVVASRSSTTQPAMLSAASFTGTDHGAATTYMRSGGQFSRRFRDAVLRADRKSTRLNSSHDQISYAVFCLKKKKILTQSS